MNRIATGTVVALSSVLLAACSGGDGADRSESAAGATELASRSAALHGPIIQGYGTPEPAIFPAPIGCPTSAPCTFTPLSLPAPISICSSPQWFTESGATVTAKMVMACSYFQGGVPMLNTWITNINGSPGVGASITTSLPGLPDATNGAVYVTFLPPTLTQYLDPSTGQPTTTGYPTSSLLVDASGAALPCTQIYGFPFTPNLAGGFSLLWSALCVDTPAVEARNTNTIGGVHVGAPAGTPYGYTYVSDEVLVSSSIGGSCAAGCTAPVGPPNPGGGGVDLQ